MTETYYFEVRYVDFMGNDRTAYGAIGAKSYAEATARICKRFADVINIKIQKALFCEGFVFFDTKEEMEKAFDDGGRTEESEEE